jgi:DNA (cytosine-5)-methyltransferase 1
MAEIEAVLWNGFNAVSTFSGVGGSCLGYRMAGFRVLWASEFIPAAQEVYRLNHPDTILDTRDIRDVQPQEILDAIGLGRGEIDLLDGSPPCASFSTAGKREAGWGKVKKYSDTSQRVDDLFFEYARILDGLQPKTFVAENVSGLVKGKAKGFFKEILQALKDCGYVVRAKLLDAQWLGVPQMRQRLIFEGVRRDLGTEPVYPRPLSYGYSVGEAWRDVDNDGATRVRLDGYKVGQLWDTIKPGEHHPERFSLYRVSLNRPCSTIQQRMANSDGKPFMGARCTHNNERRYLTIPELKRVSAFPDDFQLVGTFARQWERLGRAVPPVMMKWIALTIRDKVLCKLN